MILPILASVLAAGRPTVPAPKAGDDHAWMTHASLSVLPADDLEWLESELPPLTETYCHLPDLNWNNYGTFGGWSGLPDQPRTPDARREWEIHEFTGWNPETGVGRRFDHSPPSVYEATPWYVARILEHMERKEYLSAIMRMGCMAHLIQDSGTYPHVQAIHRGRGFPVRDIAVAGYEPQILGDNPEAIAKAAEKRVREMVAVCDKRLPAIREALRQEDRAAYGRLRVESCNDAARVVADIWHTLIAQRGDCRRPGPPALGENVALNPSFEEQDGEERQPRHWVARYGDPNDRVGRALWEGSIQRNARLWHAGRHSAKVMWTPAAGIEWRQTWPAATYVQPGELYVATAWVKVYAATGETGVALTFYRDDLSEVGEAVSTPVSGTADWQKLTAAGEAPKGAVKARVALVSKSNEGAAWFDDVELRRVDRRGFEAARAAGVERDDLVLHLAFERGVRDLSLFAQLNSPIVAMSGTQRADLIASDADDRRFLRLDGVDDFVEAPRSGVEDVLALTDAMTVAAVVRLRERREATICEKSASDAGWRLDVDADGTPRFTVIGKAGAASAVCDPLPVGEWAHVVGVLAPPGQVTLFVNGRPGETMTCKGPVARPNASLSIGADHGVARLLAGDIRDLRVYRKALSREEIEALAEAE